jgi:hypothetical protein
MHLKPNFFFVVEKKQYAFQLMAFFQLMVLGKVDIHMEKKELKYLEPITVINSSFIKD